MYTILIKLYKGPPHRHLFFLSIHHVIIIRIKILRIFTNDSLVEFWAKAPIIYFIEKNNLPCIGWIDF